MFLVVPPFLFQVGTKNPYIFQYLFYQYPLFLLSIEIKEYIQFQHHAEKTPNNPPVEFLPHSTPLSQNLQQLEQTRGVCGNSRLTPTQSTLEVGITHTPHFRQDGNGGTNNSRKPRKPQNNCPTLFFPTHRKQKIPGR